MPTLFRSLAVLLVFALAACGAPDTGSATSESEGASESADAPSASGEDVSAAGVTVEGDLDQKPTIKLPGGEPPAQLETADIVEGDGAEATPESTVTAHYVGIGWDSGKQFDASWDNGGQPISFPLNQVIAGWTEGIPGMKVGGRRLLVIPGDKAYGANPPPGSGIGPNETLVFVVDLLGVK